MPSYKSMALGTASPIISWEYDQIQPAMAYNSQTDEYLVVWEDHHWGWGDDWDIYGRRVDRNGVTLGNHFGISWEGSNHRLAPEVAYNHHDNEFLVVWEYEYSATDHDIYARRVASNGTLIGTEILIATLTLNESNPDVAYNALDNEYLIVWEHREGSGAASDVEIYGQRRAADGTPLGEPVPIGYGLYDQVAPSVAFGPTNHEYLVVWQDYAPQLASEGVVASTPLGYDIYGQRIGANGTLVGDPLAISTWQYDQVKPRLAFNSVANEFLVVWEDHHWGWGDDWDIYGQRMKADGALVGGNIGISWEQPNHRESPDVAYHPTVNEYMVVWAYEYSPTDHDVYCRRVGSDGTLLEAEMGVSRLSSYEARPALAADDNQSYFFVWEDGRDVATQGINLYGELMELTIFSGYVFVGEIGDESTPLGGVTVELYCSNDAGALGARVATATTSDAGWYGLPVSGVYEYYNLLETDPAGYTSVGATSIGGTAISSNRIQYTHPLESKTLSENKFWDLPPATMPDLIVTDVWDEESTICYQLRNAGNAVAPEGHHTALVVDGEHIVSDLVTTALEPGERWKGCFDYEWACSPPGDSIVVEVDTGNYVPERNETNNLREEFWKCDTSPPQIIAGPVVEGITQDSAGIVWETDEESDSVVRYGKTARLYSNEINNPIPVTRHSLPLNGLEPSTTYHFKVQSTDGSGNAAESKDMIFETSPLQDDINPVVSIVDPGMCNGTVVITANAFDNVGVERVEFYINDTLVFTDYSPPYKLLLDTHEYDNGMYILIAKAYDLSRRPTIDDLEIGIHNIIDKTAPTVTITSPSEDDTVSGEVAVTALVSDDEGLHHGIFYVQGKQRASWWASYPYPKEATLTTSWKTSSDKNGNIRIAWTVYDNQGNNATGYRDVFLDNPLPPPPPKLVLTDRDIVRKGNYFTINLTVENVGGQEATSITMWDNLQLFQPIGYSDTTATYKPEFDPTSMRGKIEITSKVTIPKGGKQTYTYEAVPILTPESAGPYASCPYPMIGMYGICGAGWWKPEGDTHLLYKQSSGVGYFHEWVSLGEKIPSSSYFGATQEANYLIVTNPSRLFALNPGQASTVNALLSDMAELAKMKNGVLGYLAVSDEAQLRNLLKPGSGWAKANWAYRLHPDFSTQLKGYLLIVGETEIVPARNETGFSLTWSNSARVTRYVPFSDHPYSDTNDNGVPDLIVGRIIGDDAFNLSKAIETSTGRSNFNRSDALVVSGTDGNTQIQNMFVSGINTIEGKLKNKGFSVVKNHGKDYATALSRFQAFRNNATNKDVLCYDGHGNVDAWGGVLETPDFPVNFSTTSPFVFSLACLTGSFENHPEFGGGDYNIAEAFFTSNASVFIGATQVSSVNCNGEAGEWFFENWDANETIGKVFTELEKSKYSTKNSYWGLWVWEYNLYGDPKFGGVSTSAAAGLGAEAPLEATSTPELVVPDYVVTTDDEFDHVEIPGGELLLENGSYQIPYYVVSTDYPRGYKVQDVTLQERTGLQTATGLNLPITTMVLASTSDFQTLVPNQSEGWFPSEPYRWTVLENPDGSSTLLMTLYPFSYNPLTTDVRFYKNYTFEIDYIESNVTIELLRTDKNTYEQGEIVMVDLGLNNSGGPKDVVVGAVVKPYGSEEIVDGLLLSTLTNFTGPATFSMQWNSSDFEPGYYVVETILRDTANNVLDSQSELFRLGILLGEITDFRATPEYFEIGDEITINMTFANTGSVNITGTALIKLCNATGDVVDEFVHTITDLIPMGSVSLKDTWNTSDVAEGSYTLIGYVLYDSKATDPVSVSITTAPDFFDTGASSQLYPSLAGTHNGTITPSFNLSVSNLYTYPCPGTGGHTEYVKIWNNTTGWNVTATWNGYIDDWHNISFNSSFTLYANETYNYTIRTGSYPQIIHQSSWNATGGVITCTEFIDKSGKRHEGWIPAIRLY